MKSYQKLQAYVPAQIANWIGEQAELRKISVSIVVRDLLVAAWSRNNEAAMGPAAGDPERQRVFMTVALDALLAHHEDPTLRERTLAAYHRRLAKLGLIRGGRDGRD